MMASSFFRRPLFIIPAAIVLVVATFITYRVTRPTSYQFFERIKVGESFSEVTTVLGQPADSHDTTNGTDYLFVVTGHPDYPSMLGVPFPVHRIVRVQAGHVVSKGAYEQYYDPHAPYWTSRRGETTK